MVCHSSFTDPSLVMAARASDRSSRVALPVALPVAFLSAVLSPVCLFESWSLVRRSCVCSGCGRWLAHPSLVCCSCVIGHGRRSATHAPLVCLLVFPAARLPVALPLVRRCSACWCVCWCVAGLVESWVRVSLVRRWSICWCITGLSATLPLVCSWFVARPYVRVMSFVRLLESWSLVCLFGSWSLTCSSFC